MVALSTRQTFGVTTAAPPSSAGTRTITQQAYGMGSGASASDAGTIPAVGGISAGAVALVLLVWIWWSLPR